MFTKDDIPPHPLLAVSAPSREAFDASSSQHGPIMLTRSPLVPSQHAGSPPDATPLPLNSQELVQFDNELARGVCAIRIADLPSSNPAWFTSSGATLHVVMRGSFKHPVAAADLWTGQEFPAVSRFLPAVVLQAMYTATAKLFAATTWVSGEADEATGKVAGYMTPVLATAQAIHVAAGEYPSSSDPTPPAAAAAGSLPDLWDPVEDCRLLEPSLVTPSGDPMPGEQRRKHFDTPAGMAGVVLRPGLTYTFHIWQSWCEPASYKIHLPGHLGTMGLLQWSIGIPLQIMAKDRSTGQYVVNLLMWHKGLLYRKDVVPEGSKGTSWWSSKAQKQQQQQQQQGAEEEEEGDKAGRGSSSSSGKAGGSKKGGMAERLKANIKAFTSLV